MVPNSNHFEDLRIYQQSVSLRKKIWILATNFPKEESFRLKDQIIRSARKCPANIAEGHGRFNWQENIQFCRIARGSLTETQDHLNVAEECGYISPKERDEIKAEIETLIRRLNKFIQYLKTQKRQTDQKPT